MSETLALPGLDRMDEQPPRVQPASGPLLPPRLRRPDRQQMTMRPCSLDELLAQDHDARTIWTVVCSWDLSGFLATIKARGEDPGRDTWARQECGCSKAHSEKRSLHTSAQ